MRSGHRVRQAVNVLNLATPAGLLLAHAAGAQLYPAEDGLIVGFGYRPRLPAAPAFTVGNVVLMRAEPPRVGDPVAAISPSLLAHEARHATQYAMFGGVIFPLIYLGAAGWSWLRTGDFASRNVFERGADLVAGGYRERPVRPMRESGVQLRALLRRPTVTSGVAG